MEFESLFQLPNFVIVNGSGVTIPGQVPRADWKNLDRQHAECRTLSSEIRDVVQLPIFLTAALKIKLKKTCSHLVTWLPVASASIKPGEAQNLCLVDCTKCRSTLVIRIWILAFFLGTTLFFLPYSVEPNLTLALWFPCALCAVACQASRDIDDQVTA